MPHYLNGWKEIAAYIGRGVRTVQRWERDFGLPVRRPASHTRTAVIADAAEIDSWIRTADRSLLEATAREKRAEWPDSLLQSTLPVVAVVDDNEIQRYTLARTLARAGFSVLESASGDAAIKLLSAVAPDVAVVDIRMPGMDGFEVCRRIKSDAKLKTAVVIHTAFDNNAESRAEAQRAGADAFCAFPFNTHDLIASIRKLTATQRPAQS